MLIVKQPLDSANQMLYAVSRPGGIHLGFPLTCIHHKLNIKSQASEPL